MARLPRRQALTIVAALIVAALGAGNRSGALQRVLHQSRIVAPPHAPDSDVRALVELSQQALQRAQTVAADAELHQIDIVSDGQEHTFRFTDAQATQEIDVTIANPTLPSAQWQVAAGFPSPLTGSRLPALDLRSLRIGPQAAAQRLLAYAVGSRPRYLTLGEAGTRTGLVWYVSGDLPGGPIRVIVSNDTGVLKQDGPAGVPVRTPVIAPAQTSSTLQEAVPADGLAAAGGAAPEWDGETCHESPVSADGIERDGGAIAARMATSLLAEHETKVLWKPRNGYHESTLRITAERLDTPAPPAEWWARHAFLDRSGTIDGGYPSGITIPAPGCWRLTAHLGSTIGSVIINVNG